MPTTAVGLLIFLAFLTPGFIYTSQRRALAPQGARSALLETTSTVAVSLVADTVAISLFAITRWISPSHTPDLGALLARRSTYWVEHLPYVAAWGLGIMTCSCVVAVILARWSRLRNVVQSLAPSVIRESSAWIEVFGAEVGSYVHLGLEMKNDTFVSGRLVWFSTDIEETTDRDLVLGPPLLIRTDGEPTELAAERVVVSARDISRIDVTYVLEGPANSREDDMTSPWPISATDTRPARPPGRRKRGSDSAAI